MKKNLFLLLVVLSNILNAQTTLWSDDFATLNNWFTRDLTNNNPTNGLFRYYKFSAAATGLTTETNGTAFFEGMNALNTSTTREDGLDEHATLQLKSPINCGGRSNVFLQYGEYLVSEGISDSAFVEVSTDSTVWTIVSRKGNVGTSSRARVLDISQWAANESTVYIRFRYQGKDNGFWFIDDVRLYEPSQYDIANLLISTPSYIPQASNQAIKFFVYNKGGVPITSIQAKLSWGTTPSESETINISGLNIEPLGIQEVTFNSTWSPLPNFYNISISTLLLNGTNADAVSTDNTSSLKLIVYGTEVENRVPLYEIFTSSTCVPCKPGNDNFHSIADTSDPNSYNVLKFQQDFPGTGDPYATNETVARRNYYAISSIPRMELDGGWDQNATAFTGALHNAYRQNKSVVNLKGTYKLDVENKTIYTDVSVTPLMNLPKNSIRLYSAIVEKRTEKNIKTNGETEFLQVVKKLIPNENGRTLDLVSDNALEANVTSRIQDTFEFKGEYRLPSNGAVSNRIKLASEYTVEDFDNLYVVTWIENKDFKMVLQSNKLKSSNEVALFADTFHEKVNLEGNTSSDIEVNGTFDINSGSTYVWELNPSKVKIPSKWSVTSVCDNNDCFLYPAVTTKEFVAKSDKKLNYIKVAFNYDRTDGYGFAEVDLYDKANKAATLKTYKYSLLVSKSSSISLVSGLDEKLLFYFDNRIFIDNDHKGAILSITDINGKNVLNSKINSSVIDFAPSAKGVYIANVISDGLIVNTRKFIVE